MSIQKSFTLKKFPNFKIMLYGLLTGIIAYLTHYLPGRFYWYFKAFRLYWYYIPSITCLILSMIIVFKRIQGIKNTLLFIVGNIVGFYTGIFLILIVLAYSRYGYFSPFMPSEGGMPLIIFMFLASSFQVLINVPFVILGSAIGVLIRRILKPLPPPRRYCMWCGSVVPLGIRICPTCGREPPSGVDTKICPNCKAVIPKLAKFCNECGTAQP